MNDSPDSAVQDFVARWAGVTGSERANYQLFLSELCALLDVGRPDPASSDTELNAFVFERRVDLAQPDGTMRKGYIDLYKRGCFVLEAKQSGLDLDGERWDKAMLRAYHQAEAYARALPAAEGRPPFLIVVDVGRSIELYSEFSRSGGTWVPFPDPRSHRIRLADLTRDEIRARLRLVFTDPAELDPARRSARVTREIAARLAELARSLEGTGYDAQVVAGFLMRCLFTMFAEDVGLLPKEGFARLLDECRADPRQFVPLVRGLWKTMNTGGYSPELRSDVLRFNGGLFADDRALELDRRQIDLLLLAARADWRDVEPSIFGTLLERALDPDVRHALGAHYTPRAYVERLVMPTVIEPLREEWRDVQTAALALETEARGLAGGKQVKKHGEAVQLVRDFHHRLCNTRVLDPACGSGNFLYVTLEHMKRLEGEVLNTLEDLGASGTLDMEGVTVDPHQFLGIEVNPRAAAVAEMVLWIGFLQWHFRTRGAVNPPEPVLRDFHNIENRDAVLAWDRQEFRTDAAGRPITRWDGRTTKPHPATGEPVPDESAQVPIELYINPRKADWPEADYIVGNPPFIGASTMRRALGDGYVDALRSTWTDVPESADFVMYWWHRAAELVRAGRVRQFGLITTNSLRQTFNRRIVQEHLDAKPPLSLAFAIPDHPWVDDAAGAAVRIAMTVGRSGAGAGVLLTSLEERDTGHEEVEIRFGRKAGVVFADLTAGADVAGAAPLLANSGVCNKGFEPGNEGFVVDPSTASRLGLGSVEGLDGFVLPYFNGRDLTGTARGMFVLDFFELSEDDLRGRFPASYQWLRESVLPERAQNRDERLRRLWWLHRRLRQDLRDLLHGLTSVVVTVETAKHRTFHQLDARSRPSNLLICVGIDDWSAFAVLSSRLHVVWALAIGGTLEDRPRYNKTRCFETFPFPDLDDAVRVRLRGLGEQLDAHRKGRQAAHPGLTMTGMYNVLEKLRRGDALTAAERTIHEQGLVAVLKEIHDDIDRAVFAAYGWDDLGAVLVGRAGATTPLPDKPADQAEAEEDLLRRLVELNKTRAAEEAQGRIRWLRPDYQAPDTAPQATQTALSGIDDEAGAAVAGVVEKLAWPKDLPSQVRAVRALLEAGVAADAEALAERFKKRPVKGVAAVLGALREMGW
jgi:hypothetical protein